MVSHGWSTYETKLEVFEAGAEVDDVAVVVDMAMTAWTHRTGDVLPTSWLATSSRHG